MTQLVLHAIVFHKPKYTSKNRVLAKAHEMFPDEKNKNFVRETPDSYRVRVIPKTKFDRTTFRSKKVNNDITLVFGFLSKN